MLGIYAVFVYFLCLHECDELCTAFYVDIYEAVPDARALDFATRRETSYRHIMFIRD